MRCYGLRWAHLSRLIRAFILYEWGGVNSGMAVKMVNELDSPVVLVQVPLKLLSVVGLGSGNEC